MTYMRRRIRKDNTLIIMIAFVPAIIKMTTVAAMQTYCPLCNISICDLQVHQYMGAKDYGATDKMDQSLWVPGRCGTAGETGSMPTRS